MGWVEVSLTVNGELAEAVAEVLSRYCSNGVSMEQSMRHVDLEETASPDGPVVVRAYVPKGEGENETKERIEEALYYLGLIQPLPAPEFRSIEDQNWMEAWRRHYRPIAVGERLMILPAWSSAQDARRIPVRIDPGMAFGTGTHPSTRLCLEFIEDFLGRQKKQPPVAAPATMSFIDIGCGSGILAIAALRMGAGLALAVDTDPEAIPNATANAALNGIGNELVVGVGSVAEILAGRFGFKSASLVAANILAPVIIQLLGDGLADTVSPTGSLILGGILESQAASVEEAAHAAGFTRRERRQMGEWAAFLVSR